MQEYVVAANEQIWKENTNSVIISLIFIKLAVF